MSDSPVATRSEGTRPFGARSEELSPEMTGASIATGRASPATATPCSSTHTSLPAAWTRVNGRRSSTSRVTRFGKARISST